MIYFSNLEIVSTKYLFHWLFEFWGIENRKKISFYVFYIIYLQYYK